MDEWARNTCHRPRRESEDGNADVEVACRAALAAAGFPNTELNLRVVELAAARRDAFGWRARVALPDVVVPELTRDAQIMRRP
jgi:hypothetical protein